MIELVEKERCCGCQACYNICPSGAITMIKDEEGFYYPEITQNRCFKCKKCVASCPIINLPRNNPCIDVYAAYASDKNERLSSSSGGVFAVLAREVLKSGGVVCGAAYHNDISVHHLVIEKIEQLQMLKGTKYVQSSIDDVFSIIQDRLRDGRMVMFSGTPCQVAGLQSFLGREWDNLYCVDLICHGVPSPGVWEDYLSNLSPSDHVIKASFRCKKEKEAAVYAEFELESGIKIEEQQNNNLFMKGFLQNCYLRQSCFTCSFKGLKRCSDITIGDFWSIHKYHPDFADRYGNSAVIIHSRKGNDLFGRVSSEMCIEKANKKEIVVWNECLIKSVKKSDKRKLFFSMWQTKPLIELLSELTAQENNEPLIRKIKKKIKIL